MPLPCGDKLRWLTSGRDVLLPNIWDCDARGDVGVVWVSFGKAPTPTTEQRTSAARSHPHTRGSCPS